MFPLLYVYWATCVAPKSEYITQHGSFADVSISYSMSETLDFQLPVKEMVMSRVY